MYIITDKNDVIVEITKFAVTVENGISTGDKIYPASFMFAILETDTLPDYVRPQKHCFDGSAFTLNINFKESDDRVAKLEANLESANQSIAELTMLVSAIMA